jgi:hypothetical protein
VLGRLAGGGSWYTRERGVTPFYGQLSFASKQGKEERGTRPASGRARGTSRRAARQGLGVGGAGRALQGSVHVWPRGAQP